MVKKVKYNPSSETKKTYLGLRSLFVIIWFALVILLSNGDLLGGMLQRWSVNNSYPIIAIILLAPITMVIFPVMYRIGDTFSISGKRSTTPVWKRYMVSLAGTVILLGMLLYLFTIVTFALFYRF
ncbi:MAG TPA: hypothetical protein VLG36_04345 [Candidatus Chromulinivoraceae bacterium]|nr:hypothetical protein [Candidatus Chromulinivoraceae bacterium]